MFNGFANKQGLEFVWDSPPQSRLEVFSQQGQEPTKTDDRIELNTKLGYELKKPWYWPDCFNSRRSSPKASKPADAHQDLEHFAPAYLTLGIGFDYRPNDHFSAFICPPRPRSPS